MPPKVVPGTQSWLRMRNERAALGLLFDHGALTRNQIGKLTGLSKPTAGQIVSNLEHLGAIQPVGSVSGGRGPNAVTYGVRADRIVGVAIDVDEFTVRSTVVDALGTEYPIVETQMWSATGRTAKSDVLAAIEEACASAGVKRTAVRTIALGLPGSYDPRADQLSFLDTIPGWPTEHVLDQLKAMLDVDIVIDNDVNLAAIAERTAGAGAGATSFALLWMGEGLGLAVDIGGTVQPGAAGGAGEIGYLPIPQYVSHIDSDARDLQGLLGEPAVVLVARAHGVTGHDDQAVLAALADHEARGVIFAEVARRAAVGVVPVLAILDPELIVLGGPVGIVGGELLADLVHDEIVRETRWRPRVVASTVPTHPVVHGAREVLIGRVRDLIIDGIALST